MGHHRFKATVEVIMTEPGNTDPADADPAPDDLARDLATEIKTKTRPKKGGKGYIIEKVTRVTQA